MVKIGVCSQTTTRGQGAPLGIEALHLHLVDYLLGGIVFQGRKLDGEAANIGAYLYPVGRIDVAGEHGIVGIAHLNLLVVKIEVGEYQGRELVLGMGYKGIEGSEAIDTAEKEFATLRSEVCPTTELVVLQAVGGVVVGKGLARHVEKGEPQRRADPEVAVTVDFNTGNRGVRQAIGLGIKQRRVVGQVEVMQPALGTYPHVPRRVLCHGIDIVVFEFAVLDIVVAEETGALVETADAGAAGAYPYQAVASEEYRVD